MARSHLRYVVSDRAGNVVQNAAVEIFLRATTTPVSGMWTLASGGSASPNPLISNNQGEVSAWLDAAQSVTVRVSDNSDGAYYPSNPANPQSWTTFSEDVEVLPAPEDIGVSHAHPYEPSGSVATHALLATGVHGVGASTVESDAGSTAKVAAEAAARASADTLLAAPDYLVGTATGTLSNEIAVGTSPGGELGGTWAAPTVDASHSGSTHAATQAAAEATAAAALTAHDIDTTNIHGIADTTQLETLTGSAAKVAAHEADTTGIHGITDTAQIALKNAANVFTQPQQIPLGTVALPGLTPASDPNTGLWSPGADILAWSTNGVERMRLNAGLVASQFTAMTANGYFASFSGTNYFGYEGTLVPVTQITAMSAANLPLLVKGFAGQTANLSEWQTSAGTVVARVAAGSFASDVISGLGTALSLRGSPAAGGTINMDGNVTFNYAVTQFVDNAFITFGTAAGTKIGTGTNQKIGFWNVAPAIQPTAVADPTLGLIIDIEARTALVALLSRLRTIGIIAA